MNQEWKLKVWGVRGSFPVTGRDYMAYGGNTSCISLDWGEGIVVFDAGSGLKNLGTCLRQEGLKRTDILVSHLHMDHCLGLFGFPLFHDPDAEIHLYGRAHEGTGLKRCLETLLGPPYWPLGLKDFKAHVEIHEITPGETFQLAGTDAFPHAPVIRTLEGNHPNGSIYYRLDSGDNSVIYALDCEINDKTEKNLADFARDGKLLIWDASFTEDALPRYTGWGHSSWNQGIALRQAAGTATVLMTHFSPEYTDTFLHKQEILCCREDSESCFAREGMDIGINGKCILFTTRQH